MIIWYFTFRSFTFHQMRVSDVTSRIMGCVRWQFRHQLIQICSHQKYHNSNWILMSYRTDIWLILNTFMHEIIELHAVFLKLVFVKTALRMTQIKTSPNLVHGFVETYHIDSVAYATEAGFASQSMVQKLTNYSLKIRWDDVSYCETIKSECCFWWSLAEMVTVTWQKKGCKLIYYLMFNRNSTRIFIHVFYN